MLHTDTAWYSIIRKLKKTSARDRYVPPERIAALIRAHPDKPLPPELRDYVCDCLEGKIKKPAGRPGGDSDPKTHIERQLIAYSYRRYRDWLKKRERRFGLVGWEAIRDADWWQGPPPERAARMTVKRLGLYLSCERVRNIASEIK